MPTQKIIHSSKPLNPRLKPKPEGVYFFLQPRRFFPPFLLFIKFFRHLTGSKHNMTTSATHLNHSGIPFVLFSDINDFVQRRLHLLT